MKHLRKITLSNIRRFGEDVVIDIAGGATIFLAPNGTGKTAIFEAVELAITGNVKRLPDSLDPLIRDLQECAAVRIDFDDNKFCQAEIFKGQAAILSGDHQELFGATETQDLPFLLDLTHFLNQQGKNWFVTSHGTEAGSQLEHLSIGREATEVNQLMPGAKRAANNELQSAQREFDTISLEWDHWHVLLAKRKTRITPSTDLLDRSQLLEQMNTLALKLPVFVVRKDPQLIGLKLMNEELRTAGNTFVGNHKERLTDLKKLSPIPTDHKELTSNLDISRKSKQVLEEGINKISDQIKAQESEISSLRNQKETINRAIVELRGNKNRFEEIQILNRQIDTVHKTEVEKTNDADTVSKQLLSIKSELEVAESKVLNFQLLESRSSDLKHLETTLGQLRQELIEIKRLFENQDDLENNIIPTLEKIVADLQLNLSGIKKDEESCRAELIKAETGLKALTAANDIVKQALSNIIGNYPKDRGDCPVCGEVYSPGELQSRMQNVADNVNPGINALATLVNIQTKRLNQLITERTLLEAKAEAARVEENESIKLLKDLIEHIRGKFATHFPGCSIVDEADAFIKSEASELAVKRSLLQSEITAAGGRPPSERIEMLSNEIKRLEDRLRILSEDRDKHRITLGQLKEAVKRQTEFIDKSISQDGVMFNLAKTEETGNQLDQAILNAQNKLITLNDELRGQKDKLLTEDLNISSISSRISDLRSRWANAKLTGEITEATLEEAIKAQEVRLQTVEESLLELETIERELGRWQVVEDELKVEQEIANVIKESTEDQYQKMIEYRLSDAKNKLDWISLNVNILNEFANKLSAELTVVYERLQSVNPLWQSLLRRIIIEPRFSEAALNSYGYYKKSRANVNVTLHEKDTLVSQVASEAQITDLQLTFLLAMAYKYHWTQWKTLLLDDPTQHHDLVHASAVFDLLRDYIADHDFQILLATHDPAQAKFFMRKLENDGIPVNIVTFNTTERGVFAKSS